MALPSVLAVCQVLAKMRGHVVGSFAVSKGCTSHCAVIGPTWVRPCLWLEESSPWGRHGAGALSGCSHVHPRTCSTRGCWTQQNGSMLTFQYQSGSTLGLGTRFSHAIVGASRSQSPPTKTHDSMVAANGLEH